MEHPRTKEAQAKCPIGPASCHDCAMACPYGNTITDLSGNSFPCGSDVFDSDGNIVLCPQCCEEQAEAEDPNPPFDDSPKCCPDCGRPNQFGELCESCRRDREESGELSEPQQ